MFTPGDPPAIVWRDATEAERLGFNGSLRVRWFNANLEEASVPAEPGRWMAYVDGTAPNQMPFRRALTLYARPPFFLIYHPPDLRASLPHFPGPVPIDVWEEREQELAQFSANALLQAVNDSQAGAILLAGLSESKALGRPAKFVETVATLNDERHLALKLRVEGLEDRVRTLRLSRRREAPAYALRISPSREAGFEDDAKTQIDKVCREWAEDSGEPFVILVARRGVIITHEAYGSDAQGQPVGTDYRCWVGSITKSVTAILFSQFLDQGLIGLDDSLSAVFPDYPAGSPHVPTFRQCFNHTSGLTGHGDFGGVRNPHLENIFLNAIDVIEPNVRYSYSGNGYELAGKAMEIVSGKCAVRLFTEHLFSPLGFTDVPIGNASSEGHFTAWELAVLAQWIANEGSYGDLEFIRPATFQHLLPHALTVADAAGVTDEGIGMHWIRMPRSEPSQDEQGRLFSSRTVGHGSLSGCIFIIDLDRQLVIAMARRHTGIRYGEWSSRFFQTVVDSMVTEEAP
jgi:CubicO group peptidase (beta-lactamase class C family)